MLLLLCGRVASNLFGPRWLECSLETDGVDCGFVGLCPVSAKGGVAFASFQVCARSILSFSELGQDDFRVSIG